jgi:hypothetical protein
VSCKEGPVLRASIVVKEQCLFSVGEFGYLWAGGFFSGGVANGRVVLFTFIGQRVFCSVDSCVCFSRWLCDACRREGAFLVYSVGSVFCICMCLDTVLSASIVQGLDLIEPLVEVLL